MGLVTGISWTDATKSPWRGCTKVSEGCRFCYADREAVRFPKIRGVWGPNGTRVVDANWGDYHAWNRLARSQERQIKVFPSLCDPFEDWQGKMIDHRGNLFESTMPEIRKLWFDYVCDQTPNLTHLLLTKRPENVLSFWPFDPVGDVAPFPGMPGPLGQPLPATARKMRNNVWLGTSVEDQETADLRIPQLLKCRGLSPVLWLSIEPLLGPLDLSGWLCEFSDHNGRISSKIDWVIIGNESSFSKRNGRLNRFDESATEQDWYEMAENIIDQCRAAGVAPFVKQVPINGMVETDPAKFPARLQVQEFPSIKPALTKT